MDNLSSISIRGFIVALTLTALPVASATALTIDPKCAKMDNKIGCTCALQTGGYIDGSGHWHSPHVRGAMGNFNHIYLQCIQDAGGGAQ
jgi:hypothetical protein